jgi:quercetin dioxygenase-like cupin family protein
MPLDQNEFLLKTCQCRALRSQIGEPFAAEIDLNLRCRHVETAGAAGAPTSDRPEPAALPSTIGTDVMNQADFQAELQREGYQVFYGGLKAGEVNPEHSHDWHARIMVIGGEITITRGGKAETFHVGDSCAVAAGEMHAEHVGPQGVAYIAGRRAAGA